MIYGGWQQEVEVACRVTTCGAWGACVVQSSGCRRQWSGLSNWSPSLRKSVARPCEMAEEHAQSMWEQQTRIQRLWSGLWTETERREPECRGVVWSSGAAVRLWMGLRERLDVPELPRCAMIIVLNVFTIREASEWWERETTHVWEPLLGQCVSCVSAGA